MEEKQLLPHQYEAVNSIIEAIQTEKLKRFLISLPTGTADYTIILETCRILRQGARKSKFLFLTDRSELQEQLLESVRSDFGNDAAGTTVKVMTYQRLGKNYSEQLARTDYVVCFEAHRSVHMELPPFAEDTVFIGITRETKSSNLSWLKNAPFVYSYSLEDAVRDGVIQPAEAADLYENAVLGFCECLFAYYGAKAGQVSDKAPWRGADLVRVVDGKQLFIECKSFRDSYVSSRQLQPAIIRLSNEVYRYPESLGVILLFGKFNSYDARYLYEKHRVIVWDISNLLFLTQGNAGLRDRVSQIAQFSITNIAAKEPYGWYPVRQSDAAVLASRSVNKTAQELLFRLRKCPTGQKFATQYENVCTDIIKFLFMERFNKIRTQCRTKDGLFRMDMVCALKDAGSFWGLIRHHYNSHFIVFEFKNSGKPLKQDLIYSTEKYLFDAALRNVSVMISRKGFSSNAAMAADGCLKEHGKLILDISDNDLVKMINKKVAGEEPADHLIDRLEDTLMPIGK